ncbi:MULTISPECIES: glycosyltransferase family 39 protein [unclassified Synechocystis]|uniref:ArnT family glycosyltransferase n=1 Tax=unclassified Synechocystis TaxID=2640012 RepID=UPI000427B47E|nr:MULTISPECIES: glycosyltransferase family 39 protein [unclassified Synechocystis]AIE75919.1 Polymyxin resistance protein ArnT, undecaprenyl phosphate-alpha-L-Ara4N transferase; Melittin resistance protein PqaB [Synechocystis sp. PCC 6714]MCT0255160.1 glycosyltransferase family 39 protein [Synechocystis sp. CS-94]
MKLTWLNSQRRFVSVIIFLTIFIRVFTLGLYGVADRTEARYAEIGRKMAETGDWITPQIDYGVPFWGKPPLSTWLTAASFKVFSVNEFSARLSSFIPILLASYLVYLLAKNKGINYALVSTMILVTTLGFFVSSGAVMTDPALVLGTTLSMVAFWQAYQHNSNNNRLWGYLFFVGLAIGLLAKGPIGVVLVFLPLTIWTIWQRNIVKVWTNLPWIQGILLTALIAVPWYLLAEAKTPGFLDYFIVGEHWKRFVEKGWEGDLYGSGHAHPYGMIWVYWLLSAFPWSLLTLGLLGKLIWQVKTKHSSLNGSNLDWQWLSYLLLWAVAPMIFFTPSANILWTYVLPELPAFALLLTELLLIFWQDQPINKYIVALGLFIPMLFLVALPMVVKVAGQNSQKYIVSQYQQSCAELGQESSCQLFYVFNRPYSAEFYSSGKAKQVEMHEIPLLLANNNHNYFVIRTDDIKSFPPEIASKLNQVEQYSAYTLFSQIN